MRSLPLLASPCSIRLFRKGRLSLRDGVLSLFFSLRAITISLKEDWRYCMSHPEVNSFNAPTGESEKGVCALCAREVESLSKHHLIPRSEGGTATTALCRTCHKTLHSFFTNRTLAKRLHTLEALRQNREVQRYLSWVRKQSDRHIRVRPSRKKR